MGLICIHFFIEQLCCNLLYTYNIIYIHYVKYYRLSLNIFMVFVTVKVTLMGIHKRVEFECSQLEK